MALVSVVSITEDDILLATPYNVQLKPHAVINMWMHEHQNWPNFTWDTQALAFKLADIRHRQGRLLGRMEGLGFELKQEASLSTLTNDVVKSSAIEGEYLNLQEVRSSIARHLGIEIAGLIPASRHVEGIVEMMLDATQMFSKPLTKERLFDWHAALFPTGRSGMHRITVGGWRAIDAGPMQVVSGPIDHEKIHFEAPSADRLKREIEIPIRGRHRTLETGSRGRTDNGNAKLIQ